MAPQDDRLILCPHIRRERLGYALTRLAKEFPAAPHPIIRNCAGGGGTLSSAGQTVVPQITRTRP